jgi:hypothetical protein
MVAAVDRSLETQVDGHWPIPRGGRGLSQGQARQAVHSLHPCALDVHVLPQERTTS